MKILIVVFILAFQVLSQNKNEKVILSGSVLNSKHSSAIPSDGILYVQSWSQHEHIDSCPINTLGRFEIKVFANRTYTLIIKMAQREELYKTVFIGDSSEISILLPDSTSNKFKIFFADSDSYSAKISKAGEDLEYSIQSYKLDRSKSSGWRKYRHVYDSLKSANTDSVTIQTFLLDQICKLRFANDYSSNDSEMVSKLFELVTPSTPLWSYVNAILFTIYEFTHTFDYAQKVIDSQWDPWTKGWLMFYYLHIGPQLGDSDRVRMYAKLIVDEYKGTQMAATAMRFVKTSSDGADNSLRLSKLSVGMKFPYFKFPLLDNKKTYITNKIFSKNKYLISFWATWCRPCLVQIPNLDTAYQKYHSKGLEIISVTLDTDLNNPKTFRSKTHKMPWINAYSPNDFDNEYIKSIGIIGIPSDFLIDETGTIIASGVNLIDHNLNRTLSQVFK